MLGAFTMLNVLLVWPTLSASRSVTRRLRYMDPRVALCSLYYFAASMIFPGDPRVWPDVDEWFWLHRRSVLAAFSP